MNWYETYSVLWEYKQQVKGKIRHVVEIDLCRLPWLWFLVSIMRSYHWGTVSVPFIFLPSSMLSLLWIQRNVEPSAIFFK